MFHVLLLRSRSLYGILWRAQKGGKSKKETEYNMRHFFVLSISHIPLLIPSLCSISVDVGAAVLFRFLRIYAWLPYIIRKTRHNLISWKFAFTPRPMWARWVQGFWAKRYMLGTHLIFFASNQFHPTRSLNGQKRTEWMWTLINF